MNAIERAKLFLYPFIIVAVFFEFVQNSEAVMIASFFDSSELYSLATDGFFVQKELLNSVHLIA